MIKPIPDYILLFDGHCNLCSGSVQFIIRNDPKAVFHFASLQSSFGQELLRANQVPTELQTLVLVEKGKVFRFSTGALRVARKLRFPWFLLYAFIIVPPFIRDSVYRWIGSNRYKWFGREETCWLPTPELKARFLDQYN